MNVLVVGGGGREHALCWKIAQSPRVRKLYCAPGNAGIAAIAERVDISAENIEALAEFASEKDIELTVVGPEAPLVSGIVNLFQSKGLKIFGPTKEAAVLEGSKVFSKTLMRRYGIPTAEFHVFDNPDGARDYLRKAVFPLVIKADGLAAGKGAVVCKNLKMALQVVDRMMIAREFGQAGEKIIIEDFLEGEELSVIALTDGKAIMVFEPSQDHKAVFDGDKGPNTGGMGAYSPVPIVTDELWRRIEGEILVPIVHAMRKENRLFRGVIYAGIMVTRSGPKVLEFNVRFGDPETQVLMARLDVDIVDLLMATVEGQLEKQELSWLKQAAVCVVVASGGYPGTYEKGIEISGLREIEGSGKFIIFHAGTELVNGRLITAGGRVLGVTGLGDTINAARKHAYQAIKKIHFKGMHFRKDIAIRALKNE